MYDGNAQGELIDVTIKVEDGVIVGFDDATDGYEIVDLKGKYVMPGLINLHVHTPGNGRASMKMKDTKPLVKMVERHSWMRKIAYQLCMKHMNNALLSGVTTLRSVGGILDFDTRLKHDLASTGPRILSSNMAISVPEGHMADSLAHVARTPEEGASWVEYEAKKDIDLIKLMITGGVLDAKKLGEPGELKMPPEMIQACCDAAHKHHLLVAAHVESAEGLAAALHHGVDTIEHGAPMNDELLAIMKARGACHVVTLSPAIPYAFFEEVDEKDQYNGKIVFDGNVAMAKRCLENGILVGLGTDTGCPFVTQTDMYREISYFMHYCGVSRAFALHTATMVNAKIAGVESVTGSLEIGKKADMIVTDQNPLETLDALKEPQMVIYQGCRYEHPKVNRDPKIAKKLDTYYHS